MQYFGMAVGIGPETRAYAADLLAEVDEHAQLEGQEVFLAEAFTDLVLDDLEDEGLWPDYQLSFFSRRGIELSSWGVDEVTGSLYLGVTDFQYVTAVQMISKTEITAIYKRVMNFFTKAQNGAVDVQEHNPVLDVAQVIGDHETFTNVRCCLITNRISVGDDPAAQEIGGVPVHYKTWDLESIRRLREAGTSLEPIQVNLIERFGRGVPFLSSPHESPGVETLLAFLPGEYLANIYLDFGPRLLERNVRSFLMARGKINRGIRDTLRNEPEKFLAFNNGITATASGFGVARGQSGHLEITRISELQIVNGGQTTASIAVAAANDQIDLSGVVVQLKLVVVDPELVDDLVPEISKFANRQNAVQATDLAANHPHLRALQIASRTEWTPAEGKGRATKWYFERARGAYAVEKSQSGTSTEQKRFAVTYPVAQKFGKSEVALYELTWRKLPHIVCRGGQKSFAEYLDNHLPEIDKDDEEATRDSYRQEFRDLVAKAILFKSTDKLIKSSLGGTYKRPVVAYTAAYLLEKNFEAIDLRLIWRTQQLTDQLGNAITAVAGQLKDKLISSGSGRNITEWAKQEACWDLLRASDFAFERIAAQPLGTKYRFRKGSAVKVSATVELIGKQTLAQCIENVFGEAIDGKWNRFRRHKWRYVGDSGIDAPSGQDNLHIFASLFRDSEGQPYTLTVAVDFPARSIIPVSQLNSRRRGEFAAWYERNKTSDGRIG